MTDFTEYGSLGGGTATEEATSAIIGWIQSQIRDDQDGIQPGEAQRAQLRSDMIDQFITRFLQPGVAPPDAAAAALSRAQRTAELNPSLQTEDMQRMIPAPEAIVSTPQPPPPGPITPAMSAPP